MHINYDIGFSKKRSATLFFRKTKICNVQILETKANLINKKLKFLKSLLYFYRNKIFQRIVKIFFNSRAITVFSWVHSLLNYKIGISRLSELKPLYYIRNALKEFEHVFKFFYMQITNCSNAKVMLGWVRLRLG